jgi:hypothetical protein
MTLSLNVLHHLGLNLYSSMPAVLSEVVANAWDADADNVRITLDVADTGEASSIVITDDGDGMTHSDLNNRFLHVGYRRRDHADTATTAKGRQVMGRKGIGKLSLLSIANHVLVETVKDGERNALSLDRDDIDLAIAGGKEYEDRAYRPKPEPTDTIDFSRGTRITLTRLRRELNKTAPHLSRRLARRFGVIGATHNFRIFIGAAEVEPADSEFLRMAQYLWTYGPVDDQVALEAMATRASDKARRDTLTVEGLQLTGWLATVERAGQLKDPSGDNLNRITVLVRNKLAQEDLLADYNEAGVYSSYIIGELRADFLDLDDQEDIATSSRQRIREDDPRYEALRDFVKGELQHVQTRWTELRNKEGSKAALENSAILEWFGTLNKDAKKKAEALFGRINQLTVDDDVQRKQLFAHGVLAFETMRQRDTLERLDEIDTTDLGALAALFQDSMDLEAALYHRIVSSRLAVIEKLDDLVDEKAKERFLQDHVFTHLWLLDPGWERATEPHMEITMKKAFAEIEEKLNPEERDSRLDIQYRRTSGLNVIVELKKADVRTETSDLAKQVRKYREALRRALKAAGKDNEGVAIICLVGTDLKDWEDIDGRADSAQQLLAIDTRVMRYDELLANARAAYKDYLDTEQELGKIRAVLAQLETDADPET